MDHLQQLIQISRNFGKNTEYVIAGGGNTSLKDENVLYIKASGISLSTIDEGGFVKMSRKGLELIEERKYPENSYEREQEVKADLAAAVIGDQQLRPSVETSLHNLINYRFIVHTHPTLVNGLMCSNDAESETGKKFGNKALYIEYTDPGYILFKAVQEKVKEYMKAFNQAPKIIFLQNHGIFVGADTIDEIQELYAYVEERISEGKDLSLPSIEASPYQSVACSRITSEFTERGLLTRSIQSPLTDHFLSKPGGFEKIRRPFSPDIIVYCKSNYLFLKKGLSGAEVLEKLRKFEEVHGYYPKVILEQGEGLIAVEESEKSLAIVLEVFQDLMKISYLSEQFGGPHPMTLEQIEFIDNWEVENYRRSVAKS